MRRSGWLALLLIGLFLSAPATPAPRAYLTPELGFLLDRWSQARQAGRPLALEAFGEAATTDGRIAVLIRTRSPQALRARGLQLGALAGDVVSARVTPAELAALRADTALRVEAGTATLHRLPPAPVPELDVSLPLSGAEAFHRAGFTGRGVVIGIVDTGIDWTHLDFRVDRDGDGFEEGSRLLAIWDQTRPGAHPAGFSYGSEYTRDAIERALAEGDPQLERLGDASPNRPSHGTHVLGIAAGDGSSSELGLVGFAPEAELIAVRSTMTFAGIVDAVAYIFRRAGPRPTVVNLSLGSHLGAHDGTSDFERALVALAQEPGRAIVVSAGNQGDERIHVGGTLAATGTVRFTFDLPETPQTRHAFDFWYEPTGPLAVTLIGPEGGRLGPVLTGERERADLAEGGVFVDNASQGPDPNNGLNELLLELYGSLLGAAHPLRSGRWTLELRAPGLGVRYDGWALDVPFSSLNADTTSTVSLPATAPGLIAVGAYVSRLAWPSVLGTIERFEGENAPGQIAVFSSHGPTRDGRTKPDLAAPGSLIASSLARGAAELVGLEHVLPDGVHFVARGTSFAAPHVTGALALLLQREPRWTAAEALARLQRDARRDLQTGFFANDVWGAGKLRLSLEVQPPPSTFELFRALDADADGRLDDEEVLRAVRLWIEGMPLAGADGAPIDDATILELVSLWVRGAPLPQRPASAQPRPPLPGPRPHVDPFP